MLNFKKTAVAVLALSGSVAFAGTMGPVCSGVNVTIPCESSAWEVGGHALYLQTSNSGGNLYGTLTKTNGSTSYMGVNPQYSWGFEIEGAYHFNTGNDININWYEVERTANKTFSGSAITAGGVATGATTAKFQAQPSWNAVNIEFGQHVDFGDLKSLRFHGGVAWVRVANDLTVTGTGTGVYNKLIANNSYNGFGPRVGADMNYGWGNGLSMYANAATALFVGPSGFNNSVSSSNATYNGLNISGSSTIVVPELEAKLGGTYTYAIAQGDLILNAGWMWINYFQANMGAEQAQLTPVSKNFALTGPYFGMKWKGNFV